MEHPGQYETSSDDPETFEMVNFNKEKKYQEQHARKIIQNLI